jgi:hypothetical protein
MPTSVTARMLGVQVAEIYHADDHEPGDAQAYIGRRGSERHDISDFASMTLSLTRVTRQVTGQPANAAILELS